MEDLTLISCSYNTPVVTIGMLKSFFIYHKPTKVLIIDNSTDDLTAQELVHYKVPFIKNPGGLHIKSVDTLLDNVTTTYALLVDTDVLFTSAQDELFNSFKEGDYAIMGEICGDRGGKKIHYRVHPWYCFINVATIRKHGIKFYNEAKQFSSSDKLYDVGCTFFDDIREAGLKIAGLENTSKFYVHFEGMSWRVNKFGTVESGIDFNPEGTHNNEALYNYGLQVEEEYMRVVKQFNKGVIYAK